MAGTNSLEIEIHSLFQEGNTLDYVCQEILSKYEKSDTLSSVEAEGICHFLVTAGQFGHLQAFLTKCVNKSKLAQFPLGFVVEALRKQNLPITDNDISVFEYMIEKFPFESSTLQSPEIRLFSTDIAKSIKLLPEKFIQDRQELKAKLIDQLNQNRIYQLIEQEENVLKLLTKHFPNDLDVSLLKQAHLERKADDILSRVISKKNLAKPKRISHLNSESASYIAEFEKQLDTLITTIESESVDQLYNLAILTYQFELYDKTLKILEKAPESESRDWLKAEVYLECHRYLDLLKLLENIEQKHSANSNSTYGAIYLKALAYYGLSQKEIAIRLLESLAQAVSGYRSTEALLQEWKNS